MHKKIVLNKRLARVLWLAFTKKTFLRTLKKNPRRAASSSGIALTDNDLKVLRIILKLNITMTGRRLITMTNAIVNGDGIVSATVKVPPKPAPPPPPWELLITMRSGLRK